MSLILAIDTSCDDTSAAVVRDGRRILSSVISSQSDIHSGYGGVVPELASRRHDELIWPITEEALQKAAVTLKDLSAVAVCIGPGLIGSLIVGSQFAKSIAYANGLPLIGVNHLEGHIFTVNLLEEHPEAPFLAAVFSGGHSSIYRINGFMDYIELGATRDDAAGEAYDKAAKMLGLGYPGGPVIDKLASTGNPKAVRFPRALINEGLCLSFSGLKTSVRNFLIDNPAHNIHDTCASFQEAVVDILTLKTIRAMKEEGLTDLTVSGGVAANSALRGRFKELTEREGFRLYLPPVGLCTDNAAMIAAAGHLYYEKGIFCGLDTSPKAYLPIGRGGGKGVSGRSVK